MPREQGRQLVAQHKKARHDCHLEDTWGAGPVLPGTEVKSLRAGRASRVAGFATGRDGEVWLHNVHIPEYNQGTCNNHTPRRMRKLLLKKVEITRLIGKTKESGLTIVPLS